jgi:hypothetical protein
MPIKASYPTFDISLNELEKALKTMGYITHRSVMMANKKICFFGDTNKIMYLDIQTERWHIKSLTTRNNEFLYYAAAVTLPNGDALITGGGSSTMVYQFSHQKEELI